MLRNGREREVNDASSNAHTRTKSSISSISTTIEITHAQNDSPLFSSFVIIQWQGCCCVSTRVCLCSEKDLKKERHSPPWRIKWLLRSFEQNRKTLMENHWLSRHTQTLTSAHTQLRKKSTICQGKPKDNLEEIIKDHYFENKIQQSPMIFVGSPELSCYFLIVSMYNSTLCLAYQRVRVCVFRVLYSTISVVVGFEMKWDLT